jgi:ubiquinone/menaquinone biosynthesis C-methylase UbiE
MREYYGSSSQDRIRTWIFRRRYSLVFKLMLKHEVKAINVLDIGSGALLMAYPIIKVFNSSYVGIDIIPLSEMKKYRKILEIATGQKIDAIRASAEKLPFRKGAFETSVVLDVLEHLKKPKEALNEICKVTSKNIIISLPIENTLQRLFRFPLLLFGGTLKDPTPDYHYIGEYKSYLEMWSMLIEDKCIEVKYSPIGFNRSFNFYAIQIVKTARQEPQLC